MRRATATIVLLLASLPAVRAESRRQCRVGCRTVLEHCDSSSLLRPRKCRRDALRRCARIGLRSGTCDAANVSVLSSIETRDPSAATATVSVLVRIAWPNANAGELAEDEMQIFALGIDADGRPGRAYSRLPSIGSVPECGALGGGGPTGRCVECDRLADFLHPGESIDCVTRFAMPATVESALLLFDTDHGDRSVTRFGLASQSAPSRSAP
jgi:hypothetical protein